MSHPQRHISERMVLHAIMDYLTAKRVYAVRMNSGSMVGETNGKRWRVGLHEAGTADILALVRADHVKAEADSWDGWMVVPHWIEVKGPSGKQSELQKSFQAKVQAEGHRYILAYGIDDLQKAGL